MNRHLTELALKKQRLVARSAGLRTRLHEHLQTLQPVADLAARMAAIGDGIKRHPGWVAAALVVLLVAKPRFVLRWLRRGLVGWRLVSSARDLLGRVLA